ncbi:MAG TPA: pyridoxal-phosphate dependent enzyme [Acidobacteriota bacterium]|nr:pyridoxal-phosphate dependent enzyme [Acidobacteriota bacterium]HNG95640.1 pyridoxal-phosphate dependent enzyme [Acidobacteriota bacterium]
MEQFSISQILAARERIGKLIHRTPVLTSHTFDQQTQTQTFFKCENFQRGGAFKIRGALSRMTLLSDEEKKRGVVAFSSGNHAQGVALAARDLGISATIVMPTDAPRPKSDATAGYGAKIIWYDREREDREAIARDLAEREGRTLIPPYDDLQIMAGQGTAALELFEDTEHLDVLLAPVGGGGLLSGCSTVAQVKNPGIQIFGIEAEAANDTFLSFQSGHRVSIPVPATIADGMRNTAPGTLTFPVLQRNIQGIVLVSDQEILEAMRFLLFRMKMLVEPTGAVGVAALLAGKIPAHGKRVGVILSGGNVEPEILNRLIE